MRITNITDFAKNCGVKTIGFGEIRIYPGETADVPDKYVYQFVNGKKQRIPSLDALVRTNQIRIEESDEAATRTKASEEKNGDPKPDETASEDKPKKGGKKKE